MYRLKNWVDSGALTKAEADRKIDIETENSLDIIRSLRQF